MAEWVQLLSIGEAPGQGELQEVETAKGTLCLANIDGVLHAVDNLCPHRNGPLGQGWIEGKTVVCPWHAWAFDCTTGIAEPPVQSQVKVYPVRVEGDAVLVDLL